MMLTSSVHIVSAMSVLVYTLLISTASAQQCYWPDGSLAGPEMKPCKNVPGTCCTNLDNNDLCFSNGYCYSLSFGAGYRGACTDRNWSVGSGCPQYCKTSKVSFGFSRRTHGRYVMTRLTTASSKSLWNGTHCDLRCFEWSQDVLWRGANCCELLLERRWVRVEQCVLRGSSQSSQFGS